MTNEQLVALVRAGIDEADNMLALWQQNQGLIRSIAKKYCGYEEFDDLMQEGYLGLCEAVRHYEADKGVLFTTYATFWIRQKMKRYMDECCNVVQLPVYLNGWISKYKKIVREYMTCNGYTPTDFEVCGLLGCTKEKLQDIKKSLCMTNIQSLSTPVGEDEDATLEDMAKSPEDVENDCIKRVDLEEMTAALWGTVNLLPEEQADIIRKRYKENMSMQDISEQMGLNYSAIRNMQDKAFRFLRFPKQSRKFQGYYEEYLTAASVHHVGVREYKRTWTSAVEKELGL